LIARIRNAVGDSGRSYDNSARLSKSLFITDGECTPTCQNKIKLVCAGMRVDRLRLEGFETIQANHQVFTLPERRLKKLLSLRAFIVRPIKKIVHDGSFFELHAKLSQRSKLQNRERERPHSTFNGTPHRRRNYRTGSDRTQQTSSSTQNFTLLAHDIY